MGVTTTHLSTMREWGVWPPFFIVLSGIFEIFLVHRTLRLDKLLSWETSHFLVIQTSLETTFQGTSKFPTGVTSNSNVQISNASPFSRFTLSIDHDDVFTLLIPIYIEEMMAFQRFTSLEGIVFGLHLLCWTINFKPLFFFLGASVIQRYLFFSFPTTYSMPHFIEGVIGNFEPHIQFQFMFPERVPILKSFNFWFTTLILAFFEPMDVCSHKVSNM